MVRKVLLVCGILSSLLYVAMNAVAAALYEGYSSTSQTVSELSAIGAPTRPLWVLLGAVYAFSRPPSGRASGCRPGETAPYASLEP